MGPKKTSLEEIGAMLSHVVEHMATKEVISRLDRRMDRLEGRMDHFDRRMETVESRLASIETELRSLRRDVEDLRERYDNVMGFRKEIDHALERIAAIEKHLGINKRIAA